jgi:hypothetical protein
MDMPTSAEIERNVEQVVDQLQSALGHLQGSDVLTGAIGELLKITLQHETRIGELEARLRYYEQPVGQ